MPLIWHRGPNGEWVSMAVPGESLRVPPVPGAQRGGTMSAFPASNDGPRLVVERKGYSRLPWRIIDTGSGVEVPGPVEAVEVHGEMTALRKPGFATKADAVAWLGVLAAAFLRWVQLGRVQVHTRLPGPRGAILFERTEIERVIAARKAADAPAASGVDS